MNSLRALQEKLRYSLGEDLLEDEKKDEDEKDEKKKEDKKDDKGKEKKDDKKSDKKGHSYVYRSTARETKGRAIQMTYDVDYKELMDYLEEKVPNIAWTLPKVREVFKSIRDFVGFNDPKKD